jgi:hypothetical protein
MVKKMYIVNTNLILLLPFGFPHPDTTQFDTIDERCSGIEVGVAG